MKKIIFIFVLLLNSAIFADEVYPQNVPIRTFGVNQGNLGSCMAAARVTALEHMFANFGLSLKISTFHLHAFNWKDKTTDQQKNVGLNITPSTIEILNRYGAVVPEYFNPEDLEFVSGSDLDYTPGDYSKKVRLPIELSGIYDPLYPTMSEINYTEEYFSFKKGFSNSSDFNKLKDFVKNRQPVVLGIHGPMFFSTENNFDSKTGLMLRPYSTDQFQVFLKKQVSHDVAIVGYDDVLGGFIIRNTWNDQSSIDNSIESNDPAETEALKLFRRKIYPKNLSGYYILPYAYVQDLISIGESGYTVLSINSNKFIESYFKLKEKYLTLLAPYSCSKNNLDFNLNMLKKSFLKLGPLNTDIKNPLEKQYSINLIKEYVYNQINQSRPLFYFAKIPSIKNIDNSKLELFYQNIQQYYCPYSDKDQIWTPNNMSEYGIQNLNNEIIKLSQFKESFMSWFNFIKFMSIETQR